MRLPAESKLTKAQEDHYVEWLRENEAIWRRGHHEYHKRHAIWAAYGAEVGLDPLELEAWFINKRDVYTKTKRLVSASGSGAAALLSLSDNQAWVLQRFTFYDRVLRAEALQSQPIAPLSRQQGVPGSASQPQNLDSGSDLEEPGTSQLETMEKDAATQPSGQPSAHLRIRRKKKDAEREEEEYVLFTEVRDSIKLNTEALHLLINRPAPTGRAIFIDFVSNCLKSMSEEQYQQAVPTITNLVLTPPPPPPRHSFTRPPQTHSAPPHFQDIQHQHQHQHQPFIPPSFPPAGSQHQPYQHQRSSQEFSSTMLGQANECLYDVQSQFSMSNISVESQFHQPSNLSTPPCHGLQRPSPSATIVRPPASDVPSTPTTVTVTQVVPPLPTRIYDMAANIQDNMEPIEKDSTSQDTAQDTASFQQL